MVREHVVGIEANKSGGWAGERRWQEIDRELRSIAKRRGALDAEEANLLRSVVRREIWRRLGKASLLEYLEEVLGYTPKAARERIRVAVALDSMPMIAAALATGEQSFSAVRELTRVATAATQAAWCEAVRGKNVRQIEELVATRRPGDLPTDPANPDLKPRVVRFEVSTATFAKLRQVQHVLADERGGQLDDDGLVSALCDAILDGKRDADQGRARHQILTTVCELCSRGTQNGGGREVPIDAVDVAIAECDAQRVGSDREPGRAVQDVAPMVRRFVWRRDHMACVVPGCRSARHLDVHHLVPRSQGGSHDAENVTLLCGGHHRCLHEGSLEITGRAPALTFRWRNGPVDVEESTPVQAPAPHVGHESVRANAPLPRPSSYDTAVLRTQAVQALHQSGFTKSQARVFVDQAFADAPPNVTLEALLRAAFRRAKCHVATG